MWGVWCALTVLSALVGADEVTDPDGLNSNVELVDPEKYTLYVSRWTECSPHGLSEHARSEERFKPKSESLVHTPRLGLQRRQVQCREKGGRFVENMYCGTDISRIGTARVCVIKEDCSLGEWLPWRPRPDGSLVRTRRLRRLPQGGGKDCDVVEEVRPAVPEASAHWSPGPWGECKVAIEQPATPLPVPDDDTDDAEIDDAIYEDDDAADDQDDKDTTPASCGGGIQKREVTCVRADGRALHPAQCTHSPMPTLVQPCEVPCPRDCEVGEWSEWGACQPTEGCPLFPVQQLTTTGYSVRRRRVISAASGGGAPCPPLEEKRTCSTPRCASWKALPWGPCVLNQPHTTCGPGRRTRELRCVGHDGKEAQRAWCAGTGAPARTERCRIACAGDCVVSAWGQWAPCSASCAAPHPRPTTMRRRHILAHASPNGWPCPSEEQLIQNETCNTHACATYSWLATPWGPCERRRDYMPANNYTDLLDGEPFDQSDDEEPCIEEGEMTRDVMCVQNNADVVREVLCAPLRRPSSRRPCTIRCHRGCRVEAWMPWSPCPNTCDPGKQVRVRKVHGGPNCGPIQETRDCPLAPSCKARDATWVAGEWSTCRLPPDERCGRGFRIRSIWCGSDSHRVEAGACAGQLVPRNVASCKVSCDRALVPLTCDVICADPLKYLDAAEPDIPTCVCKNVTLELLPADSDCVLPLGMECGEGRSLRAARCMVGGVDVLMDVCKKYHPLTGPNRVREASTDGFTYDLEFPSLLRGACSVRCARDCAAGAWGEWGPCAAEPGSKAAFRFRTREVIEEGSGGGRECGATLQRATCRVPEPRWLLGEWTPCVPTRALCGHAVINRTVSCEDSEGNRLDDSVCEAVGAGAAAARDATCRAPCPPDCVVSAWSDWSPCEQTKWGGRRDRTRVVLRPAEEGGADCPHLVAAEPCSPHSYSWHVAPWDDCQPLGGSPCGEGIKKRAVRCLRSDGVFVNDSFCPNTTATEAHESWCYVPCGVDCVLGEWSPWDTSACSCGNTSSGRHMRRTRQHLTVAVWPGRACPATDQRAPCPREPCRRLVAVPALGCIVQKMHALGTLRPCGWGVKVSEARCELVNSREQQSPDADLEPWRCVPVLPGRIVAPPMVHREEELCEVACDCKVDWGDIGHAGPWAAWSPCRAGSRSRTRQLLVTGKLSCANSSRFVTIEWSNCSSSENGDVTTERADRPRRTPLTPPPYSDSYIDGSFTLAAMVWASTLLLCCCGAIMLVQGMVKCLRDKKSKNISKV